VGAGRGDGSRWRLVTQQADEPNDIGRNFSLGNRKKIAKFLMMTFTCRSTFLYGCNGGAGPGFCSLVCNTPPHPPPHHTAASETKLHNGMFRSPWCMTGQSGPLHGTGIYRAQTRDGGEGGGGSSIENLVNLVNC
jgi:hypothetical protein